MDYDLDKLRRFALAVGLVLITYSVAAVELDTGATISPLGFPLKINRPEWLGIGLAIASVWGLSRFLYYGVWKTESPPRKRTPLLKKLQQAKPKFQPDDIDGYLDNFRELFPRLPGLEITATVNPEESEERSEPDIYWEKHRVVVERVNIPFLFRVAARLEDADYFAPIWLNAVALGLWLYRIFVHWSC